MKRPRQSWPKTSAPSNEPAVLVSTLHRRLLRSRSNTVRELGPGPPLEVTTVRADGPTYGGVHHSGVPQHQGQVHDGFVQSRAGSWHDEHQTWTQRGGYNGYRIPDRRFQQFFGREHFFRIFALPLVFVGGQPRFQYDGYWVTFMDPWPEAWAPNWYETDDVYLDYNGDGYYVYDRLHPDFPIAVTITF